MRRVTFVVLTTSVGAALLSAGAPGTALASPTIESESVSHVTATDATLEATVNGEGLEFGALTQFQLATNPSEFAPEFTCPTEGFPHGSSLCIAIPEKAGSLPFQGTGSEPKKTITLDVAEHGHPLTPNTTYYFREIAAADVLTVDVITWVKPAIHGPTLQFTTPPPPQRPQVSTVGAFATSPTTAVVDGAANPEGQSTTLHADYAPATEPWCTSHGAEGTPAETAPQAIGSLNGEISELTVKLEGLAPETPYCAELVAQNETATSLGGQVSFTTPPLIERAEYKGWIVSGSLSDKRLGQVITLPEGAIFNGSGSVNVETGAGSVAGTLTVPPFSATLRLFGVLPVTLGLSLSETGALEGTLVNSTSAPGEEALTIPAQLNVGVTSFGLLGLTIPTRCAAMEPLALTLVDNLTRAEFLSGGWSFAGTTTLSRFRCQGGLLSALFGSVLSSLLSGPENAYSLAVRPPGP
jgi:hypothetical protein